MEAKKSILKSLIILFSLLAVTIACKPEKKNSEIQEEELKTQTQIVEVTTNVMDFQMPKKIAAGWTTFRYNNLSEEPHFMVFEKMPDSIRLENYKKDLFPPFMAAFKYMDEGNFEAGMKEFEKIPQWFSKVEVAGGVGLTSGKSTSESTIYLDEGIYVIECYVRMPDGMPHTFMGMIAELEVEASTLNQQAPNHDYRAEVSSESGISFPDSVKAGEHVIAVHFLDQKIYESMLGHDLNLVKLESEDQLEPLAKWLNTADIKAFRTPAPEGLKFLGGVEDLPAGKTGYFKVKLEKGNYLMISEIPQVLERKMFKQFVVD